MKYFQTLKDHPGVGTASFLTLLGALAGAGNKSAPMWQGALLGLLIVGGLAWGCVLISNLKRCLDE